MVGTATVNTPVLPDPLSGPAYLVSHGGAAFPDLDLLLEGDGVHVILEGNTNIKNGITTSTFASIPDVPVSGVLLTLPTGPHSALAAYGSFCARKLTMPTTITAQNGTQLKQSTRIVVTGCGIRIVRHRVRGHRLRLTLQAYSAGRISVRGKDLPSTYHVVGGATTTTISVPLARRGVRALSGRHRLKIRVRVRFVPTVHSEGASAASATVTFKKR
jgi:hypothetical protein